MPLRQTGGVFDPNAVEANVVDGYCTRSSHGQFCPVCGSLEHLFAMHKTRFHAFVSLIALVVVAILSVVAEAQLPTGLPSLPPYTGSDLPSATPTLPLPPATPPVPSLPPSNYQPIQPIPPSNPPSSPLAYPPYVPSEPAPSAPYASIAPCPAPPEKFTESTLYTKIDYFHWNERFDRESIVNEDGAFYTVGYEHRYGRERVRFELFGGDVHYDGGVEYSDGSTEPLSSHTNYFGARAEYDLLFEPDWTPYISYFVGIGTRFWFRDLPDVVAPSGNFVTGYQETWWTVYPYIGLEKRRDLNADWEFFASVKIGVTAFTYQRVTLDDTQLYPRPGITTDLETGIRGRHLLLALALEEMAWGESPVNRDSLQPASTLFTLGLKAGYSF